MNDDCDHIITNAQLALWREGVFCEFDCVHCRGRYENFMFANRARSSNNSMSDQNMSNSSESDHTVMYSGEDSDPDEDYSAEHQSQTSSEISLSQEVDTVMSEHELSQLLEEGECQVLYSSSEENDFPTLTRRWGHVYSDNE